MNLIHFVIGLSQFATSFPSFHLKAYPQTFALIRSTLQWTENCFNTNNTTGSVRAPSVCLTDKDKIKQARLRLNRIPGLFMSIQGQLSGGGKERRWGGTKAVPELPSCAPHPLTKHRIHHLVYFSQLIPNKKGLGATVRSTCWRLWSPWLDPPSIPLGQSKVSSNPFRFPSPSVCLPSRFPPCFTPCWPLQHTMLWATYRLLQWVRSIWRTLLWQL